MKLTKGKFIDFMIHLTGHKKLYIQANTTESKGTITPCFSFASGALKYRTWIDENAIYTQLFLNGLCISSFYHDFDSYEDLEKVTETKELKVKQNKYICGKCRKELVK